MFDRFAVLAMSALCLLVPGLAQAADDDEFTRPGFYAGAGAIYALESFSEGDVSNSAGGFDLRLGYRANENFSFEAELEWAGFWDLRAQPPEEDDARVQLYTLGANVKAAYPLGSSGRFQPYGLIGFGFYSARLDRGNDANPPSTSVVNGMLKGGVGLDYYLTRHMVIRTEVAYSALFDGRSSFDYMGVGLGLDYRF